MAGARSGADRRRPRAGSRDGVRHRAPSDDAPLSRWIERWADAGLTEGATAIDVGCGSGILAVAAAKLGAASVLGVDTDPIAAEATQSNAAANGVSDRITARRGTLPQPGGPFDLVLANLIASLLVALAADLCAATRPADGTGKRAGRLLASGIYVDSEPEVRRAFAAAGLHVIGREQESDWVLLEAERPAGTISSA